MAADVEAKRQQLDNELKTVRFHTDTTSESTAASDVTRDNNTPLRVHRTTCGPQLETSVNINDQSHKNEGGSCHTSAMPAGWVREVRQRKTGKTAGKLDVCITR